MLVWGGKVRGALLMSSTVEKNEEKKKKTGQKTQGSEQVAGNGVKITV